MIERGVFGKGETALIDRKAEAFPFSSGGPSHPPITFQEYHDGFMGEYFYILRKIFHTFAFDMKEFAIDFYEVPLDLFLRALTWLTYVQTIVYEMDINVEKEEIGALAPNGPDLERGGRRIVEFLADHDLLDPEIERCVGQVVTYLERERRDLRGKAEYSEAEILSILELKSSDLEMLRRLLLRLFEIPADSQEMAIFRRIDQVREVFDDIRDYHEDQKIANFNTVIFLQKIGGDMRRGSELLRRFVEEEMRGIARLVEALDRERQSKLQAILDRLDGEKEYFLEELDHLPRG
jgi:hypothetical protein